MDTLGQHSNPDSPKQAFSQQHCLTLYTMLTILHRMRRDVGVEAALEYLEKTLHAIEREEFPYKQVVNAVLNLVSVDHLYREMCQDEANR